MRIKIKEKFIKDKKTNNKTIYNLKKGILDSKLKV